MNNGSARTVLFSLAFWGHSSPKKASIKTKIDPCAFYLCINCLESAGFVWNRICQASKEAFSEEDTEISRFIADARKRQHNSANHWGVTKKLNRGSMHFYALFPISMFSYKMLTVPHSWRDTFENVLRTGHCNIKTIRYNSKPNFTDA